MKSKIAVLLLLALQAMSLSAQVVTWTPAYPTINDSVVIEFNALQGNAALAGVSPVFAHTGVLNKYSTDILTATPFSTWFRIMESGESATSLEISTPRLIGPGCRITSFLLSAESFAMSSPYCILYSRCEGK